MGLGLLVIWMVSDKTACVTSLCSECVYLGRLTQCLQEVLPTVSQQYSMVVRAGGTASFLVPLRMAVLFIRS